MAHAITISDETFTRMQALAIPLLDTPDSVVARALAALETGEEGPARLRPEPATRSFNPAAPPSLSYTTPVSITIGGSTVSKSETHWNNLMMEVIRRAGRRGMTPKEIHHTLSVNNVIGRKDDHGYKYLDEAGVSVQGLDANGAWRQTYDLATELGLAIEVVFRWQDNPKAAMRNTRGRFSLGGGM